MQTKETKYYVIRSSGSSYLVKHDGPIVARRDEFVKVHSCHEIFNYPEIRPGSFSVHRVPVELLFHEEKEPVFLHVDAFWEISEANYNNYMTQFFAAKAGIQMAGSMPSMKVVQ